MPTAQKTRDAVAIAARLRIGVTRLNRLLRRQADTGLTPSQLSALATVEHHGAMTLGALAEHERVAPPSITKLASKLEGLGLLHREASPADGRVHLVSLTDDGRGLLAESRQRKNEWLAERLARLTPDERARLADALDVIDAVLTQEQP
ncbi:MAG TPA: MarR family transcriptional regulator [Acidimicrobiales bacterium]|nr:MarR family transcriptional regulator [Acidimicrobiales bacterium]